MKIAIRFYKNGLKKAIINTLLFRIGVSVTIDSDKDLLDFTGATPQKGWLPMIYPKHFIIGKYSRAIFWKRYTVQEWKHAQ